MARRGSSRGSYSKGGKGRAPRATDRGSSRAHVTNRPQIVVILFLAVCAVLFCRLFYLQVIVAQEYSENAVNSRTTEIEVTPRRGTIFDRNGNVLATSVDATTVYVNPREVTDASNEAAQIASVLGGKKKDYLDALTNTDTTFAYVKRKADVEKAAKLRDLELDGIYFIDDTRREYPCGKIGGQVIGFCGVDGNGITGLELYYDDILAGTPGELTYEHGGDGTPIPGGLHEKTAAVDGQDIMISLDLEMQSQVEEYLEDWSDKLGCDTNCILMDGETGEIYAAASLPLFNPADTSKVKEGATSIWGINSLFEPGSIFKTATALALLETETMGVNDKIFCPSEIEADEYTVSDAHDRDDETLTLKQIIAQSSNVGVSLAAEKMGFDKLYEKLKVYKFAQTTGVDYPGEASGVLTDQKEWSKIQSYNVSFGQGVSVTALQMVRFYGALVNDGVECTPHFLIYKPQSDETPTYETYQVVENKKAISKTVKLLRGVVTDGTGTPAAIDGYDVAGKTGTAEVAADEGGYKEGVYNISFTGFIANSSSKLVCYVGAHEMDAEGNVSPIFKDIMTSAIDRYKIVPE